MKKRRNKPNSAPQTPEGVATPDSPAPPSATSEPTPAAMAAIGADVLAAASPPSETKETSAAPPVRAADYCSTPSREVTTVSDWWRFLGLLGASLLLASLTMWLVNVGELGMKAADLTKARTEHETANQVLMQAADRVRQAGRNPGDDPSLRPLIQSYLAARDHLAKLEEQLRERFGWGIIAIWGVIGYGLLLLHAVREREGPVGRLYGLVGLGMLAFGALYVAYVLGAEGYGLGIGLLAAATVGLLMLGLFLQPLVSRTAEANEETAQTEFSDLVFKASMGGVTLLVLVTLVYFVQDWLKVYVTQIALLKEGSVLPYGLLPVGLLWLGLGLGLVLVRLAREADPAWRQALLWPLAALGSLAALGGLGTGLGDWFGKEPLVVPHGLIFASVGLVLLWVALSRWEADKVQHWACWAMAAVGAFFFVVAAARSLEPPLREYFQQRYDMPGYLVPHGFVLMVLSALYVLTGWGLASDQRLLVMTRRELASLFHSPIGYICMAGLGLIGWLSYVQWVEGLVGGRMVPEPIIRAFLLSFYSILAMTVVLPMFTMRLLSEEQRSGTLEQLLTAPVSETAVVVSKFLGVWLFSMCCFGLWLLFPMLLRIYGQEEFDYRPLLSFYLGLGCLFAHFLALGLFCSSVTRSQIVAFLLGLAGMFLLIVPYFIAIMRDMQGAPPQTVETYLHLSFIHHLMELQEGRVHLRHLVFHLTACVFWLFVTTKILEARKWQ